MFLAAVAIIAVTIAMRSAEFVQFFIRSARRHPEGTLPLFISLGVWSDVAEAVVWIGDGGAIVLARRSMLLRPSARMMAPCRSGRDVPLMNRTAAA